MIDCVHSAFDSYMDVQADTVHRRIDLVAEGHQSRQASQTSVWIALFRARSSPWLSRRRTGLPLLAGTGLVSDRAARAASLRHRRGRTAPWLERR